MTKSEPREPETLPFLVLGNKADDEGARKVSTLEASRFCEENGFVFYETSAKDNLNIEDGFRALVTRVVARQDRFNSKTLGEMDSASNTSKNQAIASNTTNKRMSRSTKTRVTLNDQSLSTAASMKKNAASKCCNN